MKEENSGGNVEYYRVHVVEPRREGVEPYTPECDDIIAALGMTFAEGTVFKSVWRKAAQRTLGLAKFGNDAHGIRDSEKVCYYGAEMLAQAVRVKKQISR